MKWVVSFLIVCACGVANAATMCVPDLSTCESCSAGEVIGRNIWSATCCGVSVSGYAVRGAPQSCMTRLDFSVPILGNGIYMDEFCTCVLAQPVMATNVNVVLSGDEYNCAVVCANNFNPYYAFHVDLSLMDLCN